MLCALRGLPQDRLVNRCYRWGNPMLQMGKPRLIAPSPGLPGCEGKAGLI